jgi:hypothetical protein
MMRQHRFVRSHESFARGKRLACQIEGDTVTAANHFDDNIHIRALRQLNSVFHPVNAVHGETAVGVPVPRVNGDKSDRPTSGKGKLIAAIKHLAGNFRSYDA